MIAPPQLVAEPQLPAAVDRRHPVAEVLARGEGAARPGDDHAAHGGVARALGDGRAERRRESLVEGVEHIGPIEREDGDGAVTLLSQRSAHLPLNVAFRLFTKASTPSFLSSVAKRR